MSDLQCPATVLVAAHGHAAFAEPGLLTDDGGWLTDAGVAQMAALADRLRQDPTVRISAVCTSRLSRAVQSCRVVSGALGVPSEVVDGLEEHEVGELAGQPVGDARLTAVVTGWCRGDLALAPPGGEDGYQVVQRFRRALEGIADAHRGETVLVLSHERVMMTALPRLCDNVRSDLFAGGIPQRAEPVRIRIDADGWVMDDWPGRASA
ncbi:histidine phosphatase family protein [Arsenicicoccus sp. oral taxon 190]|uniref:histidine phosphatase family protein n=1 Tax=Arsenicicoccus sp. oral taxon 190 TaxID=1658671 RepID=UPI00067BA755|nr:histidine phosphatase family protein [Arsenicicoccus sp. oral taxon 190]